MELLRRRTAQQEPKSKTIRDYTSKMAWKKPTQEEGKTQAEGLQKEKLNQKSTEFGTA